MSDPTDNRFYRESEQARLKREFPGADLRTPNVATWSAPTLEQQIVRWRAIEAAAREVRSWTWAMEISEHEAEQAMDRLSLALDGEGE